MEVEKPSKGMGKKWWKIARTLYYMMSKGILKSKLTLHDLNFLLHRGKLAGKAIGNLLIHHRRHYYSALTCRSNDDIPFPPFVAPREYEFSCSDSPAFPYHHSRRKNRHDHRHHRGDQGDELIVVRKVFDLLNRNDAATEGSPSPSPSPSCAPPAARQLRVSDSPFSVKDGGDHQENGHHHQVDMDAEEFIKKFYRDLKNQRRVAALESPSPCRIWGR